MTYLNAIAASNMPKAASPAESRSSPDRPLAGVRPVKAIAGLVIRDDLPQAKLGNLRRVRPGFGDHGLGNLLFITSSLIRTSRIRFPSA
jgi:hypothetical protein